MSNRQGLRRRHKRHKQQAQEEARKRWLTLAAIANSRYQPPPRIYRVMWSFELAMDLNPSLPPYGLIGGARKFTMRMVPWVVTAARPHPDQKLAEIQRVLSDHAMDNREGYKETVLRDMASELGSYMGREKLWEAVER